MPLTASDIMTLRQFARVTGNPLSTVRTWVVRYPDTFPKPWRKGELGEPDLYLVDDLTAWLLETGRAV